MLIKYRLFLSCYFISITFAFAQSDSTTHKKGIDEYEEVALKFLKDADNVEKNKKVGKLLNLNYATISTHGLFPSGLLDQKIVMDSRTYIYRFYVDIRLKRPFVLYVELEKGEPFVVSDKNMDRHKIEGFREVFFQNVLSYLETAKVAKDIQAKVEVMLVRMLKECEKYKDCEHCWLVKDCTDNDD